MPDVTNDLIYEVLKSIQDRLSKMDGKLEEVSGTLQAIRGHMNATQQDIANIYATLYRHDEQFDRINSRLELSDKPH